MKRLVFLFLLMIAFTDANSQYRFDWGISIGSMNYLGDIGGLDEPRRDFFQDIKISETRYAIGGYYRAQFSRTISVSATYMQGRIEGWDANSIYAPRRGRNLNFRNEIKEVAVRGEYSLFADNDVGGKGYYNPDFKLYAFAGIGVFHHNPQGRFNEEWHDLRPLRTEAQTKEYSKFAMTIPMGFGFYFTHLRKHRFSWEFGYRTTFTDYLDDISSSYATEDELIDIHSPNEAAAGLPINATAELAINLSNQSSEAIAAEAFGSNGSEYYNYGYSSDQFLLSGNKRNPRGIDGNDDGYMFMTVSYGHVLPANSRFAKKFNKRSRYKSRLRKNKRISSSKKSRAKF